MVEGWIDFVAYYDRHFVVVRADTPELLDRAYRLRHQVYCVENAFENPVECLAGRETDGDDARSEHVLLVHRRSGATAGTARVILPLPRHLPRPLPIGRLLGPRDRPVFLRLPLDQTAEISRYAVSKEFRRRAGEGRYADAGFSCPSTGPSAGPSMGPAAGERRLMPFITFGLLRGILDICLENRISHLTAVMDPALVRILMRLGLDFAPIGGLVEHHGLRQPCVARLAELIQRSRDEESLLWQYVARQTVAAAGVAAFGPSAGEPAGPG